MAGLVGTLIAAVPAVAAPQAAKAPEAALPTDQLLSRDAAVRRAAVEAVLKRPQDLNPFVYAPLAGALWRDGRRTQAAFWFYVFQARTRAWADANGDYGSLRASVSEAVGQPINAWLGGDLSAWRAIAERAMSYEARLPLRDERPENVSPGAWPAIVAGARADYRRGYEQTLGKMTAAAHARERQANGLPVGPLPDPGPPLPDQWR